MKLEFEFVFENCIRQHGVHVEVMREDKDGQSSKVLFLPHRFQGSHQCPECAKADASSADSMYRAFFGPQIIGPPLWNPVGVETDPVNGIPFLPKPKLQSMPTQTVPFDKTFEVRNRADCAVNFYVSDVKIHSLLRKPERLIQRFEGFAAVLSPDFSVWDGAPIHKRIDATWNNRSLGVFFALHGLCVIPHIRWFDAKDYSHCFSGVHERSIVAVSNYGDWHDESSKQRFIHGISAMKEALDPAIVFVHGGLNRRLEQVLGSNTEIRQLPTRYQSIDKVA